jgi:hypothetical protein
MPRKVKALPGPSRLSGIIANLNKEPRPVLSAVKRLSLSYAAKNDHFGARCVSGVIYVSLMRLSIVIKALCEGRPAKNTIREPIRGYRGHSSSRSAVGELDTGVGRRTRYAHLSILKAVIMF